MASSCSLRIHFTNPFPSSSSSSGYRKKQPKLLPIRAADERAETPQEPLPGGETDSFDSRLAQVRLRYKSGTGKKAEVRKGKKKGSTLSASGNNNNNVFLPPVPLKEAVSGGAKVDFGFSPYSERLNGRLAGLGLAALLLVELASGKTVIRYHTPAVVFLQLYFVAAVSAVFVKYQKERISIWPPPSI